MEWGFESLPGHHSLADNRHGPLVWRSAFEPLQDALGVVSIMRKCVDANARLDLRHVKGFFLHGLTEAHCLLMRWLHVVVQVVK